MALSIRVLKKEKDQDALQKKIDSGEIKTKTVGWGYKDDSGIPF